MIFLDVNFKTWSWHLYIILFRRSVLIFLCKVTACANGKNYDSNSRQNKQQLSANRRFGYFICSLCLFSCLIALSWQY